MTATLYVFTSPTCPHCPAAKDESLRFAQEREDVDVQIVQTHTPQGQELSKQFGVMSVPTLIFTSPTYSENMGLRGAQPLDVLHKYADIVTGKRTQPQPKPSLLNRLGRLRSRFRKKS